MELSDPMPAPDGQLDTLLDGSRFVRACLRRPVDRTPVWFLRQAGRYMQEYRDVRKHHTLVEICKKPEVAADVLIRLSTAGVRIPPVTFPLASST